MLKGCCLRSRSKPWRQKRRRQHGDRRIQLRFDFQLRREQDAAKLKSGQIIRQLPRTNRSGQIAHLGWRTKVSLLLKNCGYLNPVRVKSGVLSMKGSFLAFTEKNHLFFRLITRNYRSCRETGLCSTEVALGFLGRLEEV